MTSDIILVHTGTIYPDYINDCIEQLLSYKLNIHLILSESLINNTISLNINVIKAEDYFDTRINSYNLLGHDSNFRDGFWTRTSSRFFLISSYAKAKNLQNFFHIEYDNLLYTDLEQVNNLLIDSDYQMSVVIDSENRCIPSVVWFRDWTICDKLSDFIFSNNYQNDMSNLYNFFSQNRDLVTNFPIVPDNIDKSELVSQTGLRYTGLIDYSLYYNKLDMIFDGAALGQYLAGTDTRDRPRDTKGFVNETTIYDVSKFQYVWENECPYVISGEKKVKIANLHIHSKDLRFNKNK